MKSCPQGRGCCGEGLRGENGRAVPRDPAKGRICVYSEAQAGAVSFASVLARCPWLGAGIAHPVLGAAQESPQASAKEC